MSENLKKRIKIIPIIRPEVSGYMYKFKKNGVDQICYTIDIPSDIPSNSNNEINKRTLDIHREQNFQCVICQSSFESYDCIQTHLTTVHNMNLKKRKSPEIDLPREEKIVEKFQLKKSYSVRTYKRKLSITQPQEIIIKEEPVEFTKELKEEIKEEIKEEPELILSD